MNAADHPGGGSNREVELGAAGPLVEPHVLQGLFLVIGAKESGQPDAIRRQARIVIVLNADLEGVAAGADPTLFRILCPSDVSDSAEELTIDDVMPKVTGSGLRSQLDPESKCPRDRITIVHPRFWLSEEVSDAGMNVIKIILLDIVDRHRHAVDR